MAFRGSGMMAVLVLTGMLHSAAASTIYTVGANVGGWTLQDSDSNVYDSQFLSITLLPGDQLLFPFTSGQHNVYEVSQTDLTACNGANAINMYTETNSTVTLSTGYHGFICDIPGHCANFGMHLQVTTTTIPAPAPTTAAPAPTSAAPVPTTSSPAPSTYTKAPVSSPRAASHQAPSPTPDFSTRAPTPTLTALTPSTRAPAPTPKAARAPAPSPSRKFLTTPDFIAPAPAQAQSSTPNTLLSTHSSMMVGFLLPGCALLVL